MCKLKADQQISNDSQICQVTVMVMVTQMVKPQDRGVNNSCSLRVISHVSKDRPMPSHGYGLHRDQRLRDQESSSRSTQSKLSLQLSIDLEIWSNVLMSKVRLTG